MRDATLEHGTLEVLYRGCGSGRAPQSLKRTVCALVNGKAGVTFHSKCEAFQMRFTLGAATARAAAATATAAAAKRFAGFHGESHVGEVDADGFGHGQKFGVHAKGVVAFLEDAVGIVRLIQSQGQPGTASATGGKVDPDGGLLLALKVGIKLLAGAFGEFEHVSSTVGCAECHKYVSKGCLSMSRA